MKQLFTFNVAPGSQAYRWAARISRCLGILAALILFALIPHWYIGLPIALFGFWITEGLCGLLWFEVREVLSCEDRGHRVLSAVRLTVEISVGGVAFYFVPNWSNFEFNGHPSLVAMAGSVLLGIASFIIAAGLVAFVGIRLLAIVLRVFGQGTHDQSVAIDLLTKVESEGNSFIVMTKTPYLVFFSVPRSSVMPFNAAQFVSTPGFQVRYNTDDPMILKEWHDMLSSLISRGLFEALANSTREGIFPYPEEKKHLQVYIKRFI